MDHQTFGSRVYLDTSDEISANYIAQSIRTPSGLVLIDYLQAPDQSRSKPELNLQLKALKRLASTHALIIVVLAQSIAALRSKTSQ